MLPVEILIHIVRVSKYTNVIKVMELFNVKDTEYFIDLLVERKIYSNMAAFEINGLYHYRYGPAVKYTDGRMEWYQKGKLHRLDGPAVIFEGSVSWYRDGKLHREIVGDSQSVGPAVINIRRYQDPRKEWYYNGEFHRLDGPATIHFSTYTVGWYQYGLRHRGAVGNDPRNVGPAIVYFNGDEEWYQYGLLHRLDGPARTTSKEVNWYQYGKLHRVDGPAVEYTNNNGEWFINGIKHKIDGANMIIYRLKRIWYQNGLLHRLDGPAIEHINGKKEWYQYGKLHNTGPAVEYPNGKKKWYKHGMLHREDGPAIEYPNGKKEWYQNGIHYRKDGPTIEYPYGAKVWHKGNIPYKMSW